MNCMALRGEPLRDHILWVAKDVFLETGFERTSMDLIAARAETSKRTLYAHFENKERLYLAVVDLVRSLFLPKLGTPAEYSGPVAEKLICFCGRYLEMLLYDRAIQMCRLSMAEAVRFPEGASRYFEAVFATPRDLLSDYFRKELKLSAKVAAEAAEELIARTLHPRFTRALFGIDPLYKSFDDEKLRPDFDLKSIRKTVSEFLKSRTGD